MQGSAFSTDGHLPQRVGFKVPKAGTPGFLSLDDMRYWRDSLDGSWGESVEDEGGLDDQQESSESLYFQHFDLISVNGENAVRTGSAPADADAAVDSLTPVDIQVRVRPARNRQTHKERAERLAKFARGVLTDIRKKRDIFRLVASDQVIRHVGVMRALFDDRRWPAVPTVFDEEADEDRAEWEAAHRRFPIIVEVRNPRFVRWRMTDSGELLAVTEKYQTTVAEARLSFSDCPRAVTLLLGRRPNDKVWISDIWVDTDRCVLLDEEPVFGEGDSGVRAHGYPEPPYVIVPFRELHFEEPSRRYRGMLSNAKGLYQIESQVLTAHTVMLYWNAWRSFKGHFADKDRKIDIRPGSFIDVDPARGESIELMGGEPVPPELMNTASIIDAYIQRNGVAQGPRTQEGTRSAQQVWAIQSIRQLKVEPGKQALQQGVERLLMLIARILTTRLPAGERLTLPVPGRDREGNPIGEVTITVGDLLSYEESFDVTFGRRLDPAVLEQAKAVMGLALNNWMPRIKSWELSGLTESPEEWEDELYLQAVNDLDFMKEVGAWEALVASFGADSWQVQNYVQRMQQPPPGRRGAPAPAAQNGQVAGPLQPTALPPGPAMGAGPAPGRSAPVGGRMGPSAPRGGGGGGMPGQTAPGVPTG
jgi:hypothetical protein